MLILVIVTNNNSIVLEVFQIKNIKLEEIEELRRKMVEKAEINSNNLLNLEVIELSKKLDQKIVSYLKDSFNSRVYGKIID